MTTSALRTRCGSQRVRTSYFRPDRAYGRHNQRAISPRHAEEERRFGALCGRTQGTYVAGSRVYEFTTPGRPALARTVQASIAALPQHDGLCHRAAAKLRHEGSSKVLAGLMADQHPRARLMAQA